MAKTLVFGTNTVVIVSDVLGTQWLFGKIQCYLGANKTLFGETQWYLWEIQWYLM